MAGEAKLHKTAEADMDALVLFCMEILESVPDIVSALKLISERTSDFFELDDFVYVEHDGDKIDILYQWSAVDKHDFAEKMCESGVYDWKRLMHLARPDGSIACTKNDYEKAQMGDSRAALVVLSSSVRDFTGSIVFTDRKISRDWDSIRSTLVRIANQIFYKLRMLKKEEEIQQSVCQVAPLF